jgi:hypothetical protein
MNLLIEMHVTLTLITYVPVHTARSFQILEPHFKHISSFVHACYIHGQLNLINSITVIILSEVYEIWNPRVVVNMQTKDNIVYVNL